MLTALPAFSKMVNTNPSSSLALHDIASTHTHTHTHTYIHTYIFINKDNELNEYNGYYNLYKCLESTTTTFFSKSYVPK